MPRSSNLDVTGGGGPGPVAGRIGAAVGGAAKAVSSAAKGSATKTLRARIATLDKALEKGVITRAEYNAEKALAARHFETASGVAGRVAAAGKAAQAGKNATTMLKGAKAVKGAVVKGAAGFAGATAVAGAAAGGRQKGSTTSTRAGAHPTNRFVASRPAGASTKPAATKSSSVTVKSGDTLWGIAKANNTTVAAILKANPTIAQRRSAGKTSIFSGSKVRIPKGK